MLSQPVYVWMKIQSVVKIVEGKHFMTSLWAGSDKVKPHRHVTFVVLITWSCHHHALGCFFVHHLMTPAVWSQRAQQNLCLKAQRPPTLQLSVATHISLFISVVCISIITTVGFTFHRRQTKVIIHLVLRLCPVNSTITFSKLAH